MHNPLRVAAATATVVLLAGCAAMPPVAVSPSAVVSPSVSASPSASVTPSPSASTPVPSNSPSASATPVPAGVELHGRGLGTARFGAAEDDVEALLVAHLGKPDDSYSGPTCELNPGGPWGRQLQYGEAYVLFESKAKGTSKSPRKFTGWRAQAGEPLRAPLRLAAGLPAEPTFAELAKLYPKGKLKQQLGSWIFTTPSGVWYVGDNKSRPDTVGAGPLGTCE